MNTNTPFSTFEMNKATIRNAPVTHHISAQLSKSDDRYKRALTGNYDQYSALTQDSSENSQDYNGSAVTQTDTSAFNNLTSNNLASLNDYTQPQSLGQTLISLTSAATGSYGNDRLVAHSAQDLSHGNTSPLSAQISMNDISGIPTYNSVLSFLQNCAAGGMTQDKYAQLQSLANDVRLNSSDGYLKYITNALVNGNPLNANWTGGNATSVALGNLTATSTETQMNELIGKWFLGTDNPSSIFHYQKNQLTHNVTYTASTTSLFGTDGAISMNDINQGQMGDCYFLAALEACTVSNQNALKTMFVDNGNGTYGVRFYINGQEQYVTINNTVSNRGALSTNATLGSWVNLAEKAYTEIQSAGIITGNASVNYGNSYSTIGNGGYSACALEAITGSNYLQEFYSYKGKWAIFDFNNPYQLTGPNLSWKNEFTYSSYSKNDIANTMIKNYLNANYEVILNSYSDAYDSAGKRTLISGHAMVVYGYDSATNCLQIANPWGPASLNPHNYDTQFEVSLSTLLSLGDSLVVCGNTTTISSSTPTQTSSSSTPAQTSSQTPTPLPPLQMAVPDIAQSSLEQTAALFTQSSAGLSGSFASQTVVSSLPTDQHMSGLYSPHP